MPSKCELAHNRAHSFPDWRGRRSAQPAADRRALNAAEAMTTSLPVRAGGFFFERGAAARCPNWDTRSHELGHES